MPPTNLILVEGIPGAGKSTLAQALLHQLSVDGIAARWWYEEVVGHPVYCFRDEPELRQVVADLASGEHRRVVAAALAQWRSFAAAVAASNEVVILDGCLFGYLTWSLFPFDVPEDDILDYVAQVAAIIGVLHPCLIYLRQGDVGASWRWLCERRGEEWARAAIDRATTSPYGQRHALVGFPGLVAYWRAYQAIADTALERLSCSKLTIALNIDDRSHPLPEALAFLGYASPTRPSAAPYDSARYAGIYACRHGSSEMCAEVALRGNTLYLDGVSQFWPRNRLIPLPSGEFAVESFPHTVRFEAADPGAVSRMIISGPPLLSGQVPERWRRQEPVREGGLRGA